MKKQPTTSKSGALSRLFKPTFSTALLAASVLLLSGHTSQAGSATWKLNPVSGDWNTAANWTPTTVPKESSDTATFASSNTTRVSLSDFTQLDGIVFNAGASAFIIDTGAQIMEILGVGITNNSGITQNFVVSGERPMGEGAMLFFGCATAGSLTSFTNSGGPGGSVRGEGFYQKSTAGSATFTNRGGTVTAAPGLTSFSNAASAGNGTFINNGGEVSGGSGGLTFFSKNTTAGNGTFINNTGLVSGADGGTTYFFDDSTGGKARVEVFGNGALDISSHRASGVAIGSIEGDGAVFLGVNNLTVGSNNLNTNFSGVIRDGGNAGGTGGSLTKIGTGKLVLSHRNTYTGGTTVNRGRLIVNTRGRSGTGSGPVQVNRGRLGGMGTIAGAVTVGTGSGLGAVLSPGYHHGTNPGTLTIQSPLTFNSDATYEIEVNSSSATADDVVALGVTINSGAQTSFADLGSGTFPSGSVFTVINNTAATPIAGTFSNLADGSTFTRNGNSFKVNYQGGDGNDLTLTVQ